MTKHFHDLYCFQSLLLVHLVVVNHTTAFELQCPSFNQWMLRARTHCVKTDGYICLFDVNRNGFGEICRNRSYFVSPGSKFVIVGNLDKRKCESTRYQPFTFSTNGRGACIFEKTFCSEEGQIISSNGSTKVDRQCRCDYTRGYDFITKPEHRCYCVPSMEDCSCYQKPCPLGFIINPDYQCVNFSIWNSQSTCESILPERSRNTIFPLDDKSTDDSTTGSERNQKVVLGIATVIAFIVVLFIVVKTTPSVPKLSTDELQEYLKQQWEERFCHFIATRASNMIKEKILTKQCVVISGPHGCGKSSLAFHIAKELVKTLEYDFMIISSPDDLLKYASENRKQLFLLDDVFGKYSVSDNNTMRWNHQGNSIQDKLRQNKNCKLLMTSRLHIYRLVNLEQMKIELCHVNLIATDIALTFGERIDIGRYYLPDDIGNMKEKVVMSYSFYPALCANFRDHNEENMIEYFTFPAAFIKSEIENIRKSADLFYLALAIMVICDNEVTKDIFNVNNHESMEMLMFLSKEIGYGRSPSQSLLFSHFIALKDTYVIEKHSAFVCLHLNFFRIFTLCIGPTIMRSIFVYGKASFFDNHLQFEEIGSHYPELTFVVPIAFKTFYFERIFSDMTKGLYDTLRGNQHKSVKFRESFIAYLKKHLKDDDLKRDKHAATALHTVSEEGYYEYVKFFLVFKKKMVDQQDNLGQTALYKACIKRHLHVATLLLENGAYIATCDNDGNTALDIVCSYGFTDVVSFLLSEKAPIRQQHTNFKTALHVTCSKNDFNTTELLLTNKAQVNVKDCDGHTPLHLACRNGNLDIVELLIKNNANVNILDNKNRSAIYFAAEKNSIEIVKALLESNLNPNPNLPTTEGKVPLHCACKHGCFEVADMLMKHKAIVDYDDLHGHSSLFVACESGHVEIAKLLLENKANVNKLDKMQNTPLFMACKNNFINVVKILLERGADVNIKNMAKLSPLHIASIKKHKDILLLLIKHGALVNELDKKISPVLTQEEVYHTAVAELLKNINFKSEPNATGQTPLHIACEIGDEESVKVLLDAGVNVNERDKDGLTPLDMVCEKGGEQIITLLSREGAVVNQADNNRSTPL